MVRTSDMPFSVLRRLLLDLDFEERTGPNGQKVFEHSLSDTVLIFRAYELTEKVNLPDMVSRERSSRSVDCLPRAPLMGCCGKLPHDFR